MRDATGEEFPPSPSVAEDLVPIRSLGAGSRIVREVLRNGRPKVVTEGGVGVAVILDAQTYEALRTDLAARDLRSDLQQAIAGADAGSLVDHDAVVQELRARYANRVSPSLLQELDER
jgi:plasmid stabilization system protein ParE/PHD/YefM family antitoxin component YafN of YafNO toxin-antitoxin module